MMNAADVTAVGTWAAPALGLGLVAFINWQAKRQAAKIALTTIIAQKAASEAAEKAANAAERLIVSARQTNTTLTQIKDTGEKTHDLVNSSNTVSLKTIELLTKRIAKENPDDAVAQSDAQAASNVLAIKEAAEKHMQKRE